ncbi:MAG: hypothetical protein QM516_03180 [Limnohabitans sp.]|jgi:hypothetical protein|nr:hypothetical protein [Limnohabitans sp.]
MHFVTTILSLAFVLCNPQATVPPASSPKIPDNVFVDEAPANAKCVAEVKKSAKKGDTVVIQAKIGGRSEPFVKNRAVVVIADRCMKSCDQIPGDTCAKPWDYCCEPPESLKANTMTMQFVDDAGKVLKTGAQGVHDLEPLALIVVEGTIVEKDDKGTCVVRVKRVFVEKPKAAEGSDEPAKQPESATTPPKSTATGSVATTPALSIARVQCDHA